MRYVKRVAALLGLAMWLAVSVLYAGHVAHALSGYQTASADVLAAAADPPVCGPECRITWRATVRFVTAGGAVIEEKVLSMSPPEDSLRPARRSPCATIRTIPTTSSSPPTPTWL